MILTHAKKAAYQATFPNYVTSQDVNNTIKKRCRNKINFT